jgi:hypothetical protein
VHLHSKVLRDEGNVQLLPCAQLPSKVLRNEGNVQLLPCAQLPSKVLRDDGISLNKAVLKS